MVDSSDMVPSAPVGPGDSGADVRRAQRYLQQFGYLDSPVLREYGVTTTLAEHAPETLGEFDDNTRRALEKFQERYGLEPTGRVDDATLELMGRPRCGFPDTAEYVLQGNKWSTTSLRYGFQNFSPDLGEGDVRTAVQTALGYWSAVTPLNFSEAAVSANPEIIIRFVAGDHGDGSPFDGPSGVLAHAFYPPPNGGDIAGDSHFDEAETWSVNDPPSGIDLYTVGAHEFGHALGLAHSTVSGALMYPYYGGPHRYLTQDDVDGIQALYGALQWHTVTLDRVYTTPHSMNAWAYLHGVGWRKVKPLSPDGVTNVLAMLVHARAFNKTVTVQANATEILAAYL
jgi:hypothetical protein